ncbi:MAG: helix-turn-helix domain-containing protein [Alphaproteobacteria bacterium]|nr:helix-turn-helix domain-containing protein [Alphaproteobacteria bacterium]
MSIKIMSAVFESETLGPTERLIMLALADHADDAGRCYPSISRLCQRTGLGERAVQNNLKALVAKGHVTIVPNAGQGLANLYFVSATPASDAPPHEMHPRTKCADTPAPRSKTPARDAPKPSRNTIEPSKEVSARAELLTVLSPEVADAYIEHRRIKRAKLSAHAAQLIAKKLINHPNPDAVVEQSIAQGWTGVFPESVGGPNAAARPVNSSRGQQPQGGQQFTGLAGAAMRRRAARQQGYGSEV